jgi:ubiquinol-cytochrome c reductase cytochrome b subunit
VTSHRPSPDSESNPLSGPLERFAKISRLNYPVPAHGKTLPYALGGIAFVGFLLLFASGFLLVQFFDPSPERAYQSVKRLVEEVPGGSWLRAFHYWTAQAVVLALILHVVRIIATGGYKGPRIVTWYVGVALLGLGVFGAYFTGTVLKWDQESFDALAHYKVGLRWLGPLGEFLGAEDAISLNLKLFASHVTILPLLIVFFVAIHFYLVNAHSLSPSPFGEDSARESVPKERMTGTMGEHVKGIATFGGLYFGAIAIVAALAPAPMGDPVTGEEMSLKPPWPYLWLYGLENLTGKIDTMYHALGVFFLALIALPFLDRGLERNPRRRKITLATSGAVLLGMIGLSIYAWIAPPQMHDHDHGGGHGDPAVHAPATDPSSPSAPPAGEHPHDATPHSHD